jgi:hypothetical protein
MGEEVDDPDVDEDDEIVLEFGVNSLSKSISLSSFRLLELFVLLFILFILVE